MTFPLLAALQEFGLSVANVGGGDIEMTWDERLFGQLENEMLSRRMFMPSPPPLGQRMMEVNTGGGVITIKKGNP